MRQRAYIPLRPRVLEQRPVLLRRMITYPFGQLFWKFREPSLRPSGGGKRHVYLGENLGFS